MFGYVPFGGYSENRDARAIKWISSKLELSEDQKSELVLKRDELIDCERRMEEDRNC